MLDHLNDSWIDILTGHASARFKYLDVRSEFDFAQRPPGWNVMHIPLEELHTRVPKALELGAEIVVYGATDAETQAAQSVLTELGFDDVLAFEGGFEALRVAGLV